MTSGLRQLRRSPLRQETGFTLIGVLFDVALLAVVVVMVALAMKTMAQRTALSRDRAFATQKIIQLTDELRSVAMADSDASIRVLNGYDDTVNGFTGALGHRNLVLTTQQGITSPGASLSGNSDEKFYRHITILAVQSDPSARRVHITVGYNNTAGTPLAENVTVISTLRRSQLPTQVFDVYALAIDNVPSTWLDMASIHPNLDEAIRDVVNRNPGLEFRLHKITRSSYGRDRLYTPHLNSATDSVATGAFPWVYLYPGTLGGSSIYSSRYLSGRFRVDGAVPATMNDTPVTGVYAFADAFNHAMRYTDEVAAFNAISAYNASNGLPQPEISLRMLLENLYSDTPSLQFQNVLLLNLHGDILPLPPIRNYSYAAKIPSAYGPTSAPADLNNLRYARVVSHPSNLAYPAGATVNIRVYPYVMTGSEGGVAVTPDSFAVDKVAPFVTVRISSINVTGTATIRKAVYDTGLGRYDWQNATAGTDYQMVMRGPNTDIILANVPLRHACPGGDCSLGGLAPTARLYGLEYIPCEVAAPAGADFIENSNDLMSIGAGPKNTARYRITITGLPTSVTPYQVQTWFGNLVEGPLPNLSNAYFWVGAQAPQTEKYQYLGDPRHMPYHDVKQYDGYNWYFRATPVNYAAAGYGGYALAADGWKTASGAASGPVIADVPRFLRLYREGIIHQQGVASSLSGFTGSKIAFGGEITHAASAAIQDVPWMPASGVTGTTTRVDELSTLGPHEQRGSHLVGRVTGNWVALPWIGELYPDDQWATWQANGNLPTAFTALPDTFYRANFQDFKTGGLAPQYAEFDYPDGPGAGKSPTLTLGDKGAPSLLNSAGGAFGLSSFGHVPSPTANGILNTTYGTALATAFSYPLPDPAPVCPYPFNLRVGAPTADEWSSTFYTSERRTISIGETHYNSAASNGPAAGIIKLSSQTASAGYWAMSGVGVSTSTDKQFICRFALMELVQGMMLAGDPANTVGNIAPVPAVTIIRPVVTDDFTSATTIPVMWGVAWNRWDGGAYTTSYPASFNPSISLVYHVKYSADSGKTWFYAQDRSPAQPGVLGTATYQVTTNTYNWGVTSLPAGKYTLRVEVFRVGVPQHYAYHNQTVLIQ